MPAVLPFLIAAAKVAYAAVQTAVVFAKGILDTVVFAGLTVGNILTGAALIASAVFSGAGGLAKQKSVIRQPISPRRRIYGETKVGGVQAFIEDTKGWLAAVVLVASHQIDSYRKHYLNDEEITLARDAVDPPVGAADELVLVPKHFFKASGDPTGYVFIYEKDGADDQTAHARLITIHPDLWTTDHRIRGTANVLILAQSVKDTLFPGTYPGGAQEWNGVVRGARVFDPREAA